MKRGLLFVQAMLETSFITMKKKLDTRTRASRAKTWSNQHGHSASTQVTKSIFFNILTSKQKLPARKRDFTMNIPEVQKVRPTEVTRALSKNVRLLLLKNNKDKFPFGVGRQKPYLSEERRGKPSYYTESKVKELIDEVLNDPLVLESLRNSLVSSSLFYEYLKVIFIEVFKQRKENEDAFFDTYASFGINRKQLALNKNKISKSLPWKHEGMTDKDIEGLAEQYANKTIKLFKERREMSAVFYKIMGLLFFGNSIRN
ncbi:MAG: hypothetical protein WCA39_00630 [Nitrososphaeraceae archaeon]